MGVGQISSQKGHIICNISRKVYGKYIKIHERINIFLGILVKVMC